MLLNYVHDPYKYEMERTPFCDQVFIAYLFDMLVIFGGGGPPLRPQNVKHLVSFYDYHEVVDILVICTIRISG